jgi:putative salt-induced outer membrane protein YdiY
MNDGSLLKGTISKVHNGKIILKTTYAGTLSINQAEVESYSTLNLVNVKKADDIVFQEIITHEKNTDVKTMWSEGHDPDIFQNKWIKKVWFAFRNTDGNTDERNLNIGFDLTWLHEFDTFKIYGKWSDEESNGRQTTDEWITGLDYEQRFKDSKSSWYTRAEYERDKINDIKLAQTYAAGYGHYFIDEGSTSLRGRAGLQYRMDDFYNDEDKDSIGLDFGLNFKTDLSKKIKWFSDVVYTPAFEDPEGDYKISHESGISMPLDSAWDMYLKAGIEHDYNSLPSEGKKHLDTEYFLRLEIEF